MENNDLELWSGPDVKGLGEQNLHICSPDEKQLIPVGCLGTIATVSGPAFARDQEGVFWRGGQEEGFPGIRAGEEAGDTTGNVSAVCIEGMKGSSEWAAEGRSFERPQLFVMLTSQVTRFRCATAGAEDWDGGLGRRKGKAAIEK